jgi:methyl-accepting chemotaxis protein
VSGVFMDANELYLNTMGFDLKQLSGRNVMDIAKENRDELKDFMTRIKKGESFEGKVVRKTSLGESKTLFASYTPYINAEGKIEKVIFLAIDLALANKV